MRLERWRCGEDGCRVEASGVGDLRGLRAIGWNVEQGRLLCPRHRTDRTDLLVVEEVHKIQGMLGVTTMVGRVAEYFGAPTLRPPDPGEPALWPAVEPGTTRRPRADTDE